MNLRLWLLALPGLLISLTGCGPIYDTRYDLIPPTDDAGRFCTVECERLQLDCRRAEDRKYQDCTRDRQDAQNDYQRCLNKHKNDSSKCRGLSPNTYCSSANYSMCDSDYRRCFQNCGGQVHSYQVCVFNCP
jgi:hypothetical protein